ncbi:MAG: aminotransferase class IV [Candidatus Omnitrophica bacterium]|nr:aminotransferase class IV [Candidatus Omnitrophota bacterium]
MTVSQLFVNGKRVSSDCAILTDFTEDKIFVFESLRSYNGTIFRLEEHLERLFDSARTIGLKLPKTRLEIKNELISTLASQSKQDAFLRLGVDERDTYLVVSERKRPEWIYEKGVDLKTAVTRRNFAKAEPTEPKTSAFFNNVLAELEKMSTRFFDTIFLDSSGYITEGTIWNLFMLRGRELLTPQTGILNGVTRQFVMECAAREDVPVSETHLTRHDFWNADEAFMTNTSGEIVPIRSLDGRQIGRQVPGHVTKTLMTRFREELDKELKKA